jgi:Secretion system C-terminal sorting domain
MRRIFLLISMLLITGVFLRAQTVDVTFQVDMSIVTALETFNPATDTVMIRGSFNGWGDGVMMTPDNNDSVYVVTLTGQPQSTTIFYKFFHTGNNGTWESDPNREVDPGTATTLTVDPSFFDDKNPYTGVQTPVTFTVDMHLPAQGTFDPAVDHVFIAGNFTDWGTSAVEMSDPEGDTTFTVTINNLNSGDLGIYKFVWSHDLTPTNWESGTTGDDIIPNTDGNRIYGVHDGANDVSRFWLNTNPNVQLADGSIFFEVDMSVVSELGVFNSSVDSIQIRGGFNGWNGNDVARSHMIPNAINADDWTLDIPFTQEILGNTEAYKFFIQNGVGSTPYPNTGWEVVLRTSLGSDRNRSVSFEGNPAQEAPFSYWENVNPDWVIEAGTTVECTFSVDMTYAADPDSQGTPQFNQATDSVLWIPRQPLYYAVNGLTWPGEYPRVLVLTDPESDMIYTGTMTINGPSFNGFLYDYGYVSNSDQTLYIEDGGQGGARVRFIGQNGGPRTFDTPWTMPQDVWSNSEKPEEDHPQGWVDVVEQLPINPTSYSLEQNYPNPFNPSTMIRFSIPEKGLVTLKVYSLLGEEVETLINNNEMSNGTYEVDFKGNNLASGIYFYTLKVNNFVSTKKMMLIK